MPAGAQTVTEGADDATFTVSLTGGTRYRGRRGDLHGRRHCDVGDGLHGPTASLTPSGRGAARTLTVTLSGARMAKGGW